MMKQQILAACLAAWLAASLAARMAENAKRFTPFTLSDVAARFSVAVP